MKVFILLLLGSYITLFADQGRPSPQNSQGPKSRSPKIEKPQLADDRIAFRTGFFLDNFNYSETNVPDFQQISIKLFGTLAYLLPEPPLSLELAGYHALLPLTHSGSNSVKLFGLSASAFYLFSYKVFMHWRPTVGLGYSYDRMIVVQNAFGVNNVSGPKLTLGLGRSLRHQDSLIFLFNFGKVFGNETTTLAGSNWSLGGIYEIFISDQVPTLFLFANYSNSSLTVAKTNVSSNVFALGGGIEFH